MRAYLVAEGPQDVAFLGRLLEVSGFEQYRSFAQLEAEQPGWARLVPRAFPARDALVEPLIIPSYFRANDGFVCLQSSSGYDRLSSSVEKMLATVPAGEIDAIAAFPDADTGNPAARFEDLSRRFSAFRLSIPDRAGELGSGAPRVGIFVLPDNRSLGSLEDLLIESAMEVYPSLHEGANRFIDEIDKERLSDEDLREIKKPAGVKKAIVGCVGNVLKPGRTAQDSISSNRWISEPTLRLLRIRAIHDFLASLLDLKPHQTPA